MIFFLISDAQEIKNHHLKTWRIFALFLMPKRNVANIRKCLLGIWIVRGWMDSFYVLPFPGKFEEKEDRVPKLEQLNSLGFMCSLNLILNKRDLIKMELLLLETFGWNLCMPTPAHFIDYYLHAAVQEGDLYNGWPLSSMSKTKAFMDKYTHYFLEVSLQGEFKRRRG